MPNHKGVPIGARDTKAPVPAIHPGHGQYDPRRPNRPDLNIDTAAIKVVAAHTHVSLFCKTTSSMSELGAFSSMHVMQAAQCASEQGVGQRGDRDQPSTEERKPRMKGNISELIVLVDAKGRGTGWPA